MARSVNGGPAFSCRVSSALHYSVSAPSIAEEWGSRLPLRLKLLEICDVLGPIALGAFLRFVDCHDGEREASGLDGIVAR